MTPPDTYRLAVDFGTTNTAAAVHNPGRSPWALRLGSATDTVPSAVLVLASGELVTGEEAVRQAVMHPAGYEPAPKRRLGEPAILLAGAPVSPVQLTSQVLAGVMRHAMSRQADRHPDEVILTHPERWGDHLRGRLLAAAAAAGYQTDRVRLVSEPVAAAHHYALHTPVATGDRIAVVDFGGGTCDAAVLDCVGLTAGTPMFRIASTDGEDHLGGDDVDQLMYGWVLDQLRRDGQDHLLALFAPGVPRAAELTLRDQIRRAKHALSLYSSAAIPVGPDLTHTVLITSAQFEQLIGPLVSRAVRMTQRVLQEADAAGSARPLRHLYLTGGSSHIPLVQREFQELSGNRVATMDDPKQVTVLGALVTPAAASATHGAQGWAPDPSRTPDPSRAPDPRPASHAEQQPAPQPDLQPDPNQGMRHGSVLVPDLPPPRRRPRPNRKVLLSVLGGLLAVLLLPGLVRAFGSTGQSADPGPSTGTRDPACAGLDSSLTDQQCKLVSGSDASRFVQPITCRPATAPYPGVSCRPASRSSLDLGLDAQITVVSYPDRATLDADMASLTPQAGSNGYPTDGSAVKVPMLTTWTKDKATMGGYGMVTQAGRTTLRWTYHASLLSAEVNSVASPVTLDAWWSEVEKGT